MAVTGGSHRSSRAIALMAFALVANLAPIATFGAVLPEIAAAWQLSASDAGWIGGGLFGGDRRGLAAQCERRRLDRRDLFRGLRRRRPDPREPDRSDRRPLGVRRVRRGRRRREPRLRRLGGRLLDRPGAAVPQWRGARRHA